ncbi:transcriptional regulator family: C2H2 zinc finger [Penicillium psychrosexuale]|uniref:transcriptional regulator family: C2H2 zinc finger n=1 Tax=Penicillium psychrosexuale TaxID=1002107 RepID=UPI0025451D3B|nr:transcriptional regulator family: C2H2 zinc finger [Penicillium psychrosexuale]KAJ5800973.1 transcriptional regulator family: C2H2 zinc finger [Penicillium psychrosexuale]
MAWPTRNNIPSISESAFPWSGIALRDWTDEYLLTSPSTDPSLTTRAITPQPLSYNYQLQPPSTQPPFASSYFPSTPVIPSRILSLTPSPSYLDPGTISRSTNHSPTSVSSQATTAVHSPASLYDTRWDDLPVSAPIIKEPLRQDDAGIEPSRTKMPCRSRGPAAKKGDDDYGTFECKWEGCRYDRLFSRKGVLMRHIETQHVTPRAFECPSCDHASSRRENLKAHRQAVHRESL